MRKSDLSSWDWIVRTYGGWALVCVWDLQR